LAPKYLRKWLYNFLIYNNVPEGVADFIEGRSANTVGSMHYLARAKQADHWYSLVVEKLQETLELG
jgi:intergrase/recombinase